MHDKYPKKLINNLFLKLQLNRAFPVYGDLADFKFPMPSSFS